MTDLICIVCPKGCHLHVDEQNDYKVTGHDCARGEEYGRAELLNPLRVITSTVVVQGALHRRCPVKTDGSIPKGKIMQAMCTLDTVCLRAPVQSGQVVVENLCGTGVNFVATREMPAET